MQIENLIFTEKWQKLLQLTKIVGHSPIGLAVKVCT